MSKQIKSVHLYGKPTAVKKQELFKMQKMYTNHINFFIKELLFDKRYYMDILNNNKKSSKIRALEKSNRTKLGSALGQNCIDHAVKELHNSFIRIRNKLYGYTMGKDANLFVSSIALLNACIMGLSPKETKELVLELNKKSKSTNSFHENILNFLNTHKDEEIESIMIDVNLLFFQELQLSKKPFLKNTSIQLDSRLFTLEEAKNIKADYVLCIKTLKRRKRIEIPLKTSSNGVRRLKQYKIKSPTFKIVKSGIRLSIPFEKEVKINGDKNNLIGIDVGVTDLLYTSKGKSIGNYSKIVKHYEENVMVKMKNRSNLKNLMRKYQSELVDKNTNEFRKDFLRRKINNINKMLQGKNTKNRILRSYYHMQDVEISTVVKKYVDLIKDTNAITVIEDLDIVNFDRGKTTNRRDSMWSRGQLLKKIEEYLTWNRLELIKVDPAYTSKVCPHCFNIDNSNRKGKSFKCSCCGHTDDADHNAAVNIKSRAFDEEIKNIAKKYKYNTKKRHTELKNLYALRHEKYKTTVA